MRSISKIETSGYSISFSAGDSYYKILNLPAFQLWIDSDVILKSSQSIKLECSGLVSIRYDNYPDITGVEDSIRDFVLEFERYYRTE